MTVTYVLEEGTRRFPEARHALETLALLMGYPSRFVAGRAELAPDDIPVLVGDARAESIDAAAIVEVRGWETWQPAELRLAEFEGRPLPCPGGVLAPPEREAILPAAWLRSVGFLLAREEEAIDTRRDQWNCFAGTFSRLHDLGVLERPMVNHAASELVRRIEVWCARKGIQLQPLPRWKNGARFAAVLSHDVDDIRIASIAESFRLLARARSPRSYALRRSLAQLARSLRRLGAADDPYWRFEQWVGEEERYGFRSTFFVFPPSPAHPHEFDPTYRLDDAIRFEGRAAPFSSVLSQLARRGFEIGLHASYESYRSAEQLAREKAQVEQAADVSISGIRQHFLRFEIPATWAAQQAAGFAYDSTLGYNEAVGFRAGIAAPFRPWDPARRAPCDLLELPLTVMDGALFRSLKLGGDQAARRTLDLLAEVERSEGLAVLLWHPNGADAERFPGWWNSYRQVLAHLSARSAWVATGSEINAWWREREKAIFQT